MTVKAMAKLYGLLSLFITQALYTHRVDGEGTYGYDPEASITGLYTGPYFDPLAPRNFTAHLGDQANLPCTVRQLGDKSVSWVRMRDADILTVDRYTFVGDERFESHYSAPLETWNLVIKYVQERDAGLYECQVSTEPKMSQLFSLRVVIPKVAIMPPGDRYVKAGSQVRVDCQITDVVQLPDYIFWYHEDKRVMDHLDSNLMVTVKKAGVEAITSTLTVHKVPPQGSGNYTCMPSNLHAASVVLHVLNEKHPAAMQGDFNGSARQTKAHPHLLLLLMVFVMLCRASYLDFNEGNNEATSDEQQPLDRPTSFSGKVTLSSSASSLSRLSSTCAFHLDHTSMKKILMALEDDIDATENGLGKDAICFQDFPERVSSSSSSFSARKFQSRIGEPRVIYYWSRALIEPSSGVLDIQPLVSIREVIEGYREVTQHLIAISKWIPAKINIDRADRDHDEEEGESEDLVPQASFWSCHSHLRQWAPLVVNR